MSFRISFKSFLEEKRSFDDEFWKLWRNGLGRSKKTFS